MLQNDIVQETVCARCSLYLIRHRCTKQISRPINKQTLHNKQVTVENNVKSNSLNVKYWETDVCYDNLSWSFWFKHKCTVLCTQMQDKLSSLTMSWGFSNRGGPTAGQKEIHAYRLTDGENFLNLVVIFPWSLPQLYNSINCSSADFRLLRPRFVQK